MPIFEFQCSDCGRPFEELVRSSGTVEGLKCPSCGSEQVKKKISTFASKISGGSPFSYGPSTSSCSTGGST